MRYDHVIWDWNGTLLDDVVLAAGIVHQMLLRRGLGTLEVERHRQLFTHPVRDYYEAAGFNLERDAFEVLTTEFHEEYLRRWRECTLREHATEAIVALSSRGTSQSVLSAAEQRMLEDGTSHFGLTATMRTIAGLDDFHAVSKVERGRALLATLEVDPARVLLVGDTGHDHEVAAAIGVDVALIEDGHATSERLRATGAPVFASLVALLEWVA
ncbi:MAG: HAD hydrolase-like protein [Dehalococcoidia bacterium]